MLLTMGEKIDPEKQPNQPTIHELQTANQHLNLAFQNLKQERDMLRKALHAYHFRLRFGEGSKEAIKQC